MMIWKTLFFYDICNVQTGTKRLLNEKSESFEFIGEKKLLLKMKEKPTQNYIKIFHDRKDFV